MGIFDKVKEFMKKSNDKEPVNPLLIRPAESYLPMGSQDVAKVPIIPMSFRFMYDIYYYSDVLRTTIRSLVWEIFRNGIEIVPKFRYKCLRCQTIYESKPDKCSVCGGQKFEEPDYSERGELLEKMKDVNFNNQSILDVLQEVMTDVAVVDNGYFIVLKKYYVENGEIVGAEPVEVLRGSPMRMRMIMNRYGRLGFTDDNQIVATCINHRDEYWLKTQEEMEDAKCPKCGTKLYPAFYMMEDSGNKVYYIDGEVFHWKMFSSGVGYGVSPILSIWIKAMVLMKMDWFVLMAYHLQRPPKGLLIMRGNRESIEKAWQWLQEQARTNPHMIAPLVVEGGQETSSKRVSEFIDLTVKSNDIDFVAYRNELRRTISSIYGVMPLWQGEVKGGLSNEGLQITVTNRVVEMWQKTLNEKVLPWISKQLGVADWTYLVKPSEIRDELTQLELEIKRTQLARAISELGYKPVLVMAKDGIEYQYEKKDIDEQLIEDMYKYAAKRGKKIPDELVEEILSILNSGEQLPAKRGVVPGDILRNPANTRLDDVDRKIISTLEGQPESKRPSKREQRLEGEPLYPEI